MDISVINRHFQLSYLSFQYLPMKGAVALGEKADEIREEKYTDDPIAFCWKVQKCWSKKSYRGSRDNSVPQVITLKARAWTPSTHRKGQML